MLTLILALAAGVCLAVGWLTEQIALVYVALGVSGVGLVLMAVQVWSRRRSSREDSPSTSDVDDDEASEPEDRSAEVVIGDDERLEDESEAPEPTTASVDGDAVADAVEDAEELIDRASLGRLAEDSTVYVISGRRRFHMVDCRLLDGRDIEELTLIDAEEEAFTPCTICVETETRELLAEQH